MKTEKCCGLIVFRNSRVREFLLVKHKDEDGGHWMFPKGHVEPGESEQETALRELKEETCLTANIIDRFRETICYLAAPDVQKTVVCFLGEADSGGDVIHCEKELDGHIWLPIDEAIERATHDNTKQLLQKAEEFLQNC